MKHHRADGGETLTHMVGGKGKNMFVHDGHKFYEHYKGKTTRTLRCSKNTCRAKLYVGADNRVRPSGGRFQNNFEHNHDADPEARLGRQMVSNAARVAAVRAPTRPPSRIVRDVMQRTRATAADELKPQDLRLIRRCVHNARASRRGADLKSLPRDRLSVHRHVRRAAAGLTLVNDAARGVLVFGTAEDADRARRLRTLYVDGTSAYRPRGFDKLCVVHTYENAAYQPLMFCCLPNGSRTAYEDLLNALRDGVGVRPDVLAVDCDGNAVAAARSAFPDARVRVNPHAVLCAWRRKAVKLKLRPRAAADRRWMRQVFGLPFLDADAVERCFVDHCMARRPDGRPFVAFTDYLADAFVDTGCCEFPPSVWATGDGSPAAVARRVERAVASRDFHRDLYYASYHLRPHVYRLLDTFHALSRSAAAKRLAPLGRRAVDLRTRVTRAAARYQRGEMTAGTYAAIAGRRCGLEVHAPVLGRYGGPQS